MLDIARFTLTFTAQKASPPDIFMGSAWRGAFGHALMATDPQAYACLFEPAAYVPEEQVRFLHGATPPHPYIVCPVGEWPGGDGILTRVELILFGRGIDHTRAALQALIEAAANGIGTQRYRLVSPLIEVLTSAERVQLDQHPEPPPLIGVQVLHPMRLREPLGAPAFVKALLRRYQQLDICHSQTADNFDYGHLHRAAKALAFVDAQWHWFDWKRHSSRQKKHIPMGGEVGTAYIEGGTLDLLWPILWLGQWLHVGKGSVMGMGRYQILQD